MLDEKLMKAMELLATSMTHKTHPRKLAERAREVKILSGRLEREIKNLLGE